jgi:hypothetical protein
MLVRRRALGRRTGRLWQLVARHCRAQFRAVGYSTRISFQRICCQRISGD